MEAKGSLQAECGGGLSQALSALWLEPPVARATPELPGLWGPPGAGAFFTLWHLGTSLKLPACLPFQSHQRNLILFK